VTGLVQDHVESASEVAGKILGVVNNVIHYHELIHGRKYEDSKVPELEPPKKEEAPKKEVAPVKVE